MTRTRGAALAIVLATQAACAHVLSTPSAANEHASVERATVLDPSLAAILVDEGYVGVIAVADEGQPIRCSDLGLCDVRVTPASTFKITNAMIALETGVAPDAELVIPWDGRPAAFPDWEHDHTLRSAMAVSAVPYYQELARRIGLARMRAWVTRLGYGNMELGTVVDRFWLDGPLAIAPREQVEFLERLATGALPIHESTRLVLLDVLTLDRTDGVLRGKTGWAHADTPDELGWFVGWREHEGVRRYVAVLLRPGSTDRAIFRASRRRIAERVLARPAP